MCHSEAYLGGGALGHGPFGQNFFFDIEKKIGKLGLPLLCMSTGGQRKYATGVIAMGGFVILGNSITY